MTDLKNNTLSSLNPLVPEGRNIYRNAKILLLKKEGFKEKFPMSAASMSR